MKSIFEGAKFGDKFLTKDNDPVLFIKNTLRKELITYCYHQDYGLISYNYQNGKCLDFTEGDCDIVSKYQKSIDEKELTKIEERAYKEYPIIRGDNTANDAGWDGYVKGATDQQKIDAEKAWKWMMTHVCLHLGDKESFRKTMEEQI